MLASMGGLMSITYIRNTPRVTQLQYVQVYIATGSLVRDYLKQDRIDYVVEQMQPFLANGQYSMAMENAVLMVGMAVSRNEPQANYDEGYDADSYDDYADHGEDFFGEDDSALLMVMLPIFSAFIAYLVYVARTEHRREQAFNRHFEQIQKDVKVLPHFLSRSPPASVPGFRTEPSG